MSESNEKPADDIKTDVVQEPKTHPEARYLQAVSLATTAEGKSLDELTDIFERTLQLGERRGIGACLNFLDTFVGMLNYQINRGKANHIKEALARLNAWVTQSDHFQLWERPKGMKRNKAAPVVEPRRFIGQPETDKANGS